MCKCKKNIKIGSYKNSISIINPFNMKFVNIDLCILKDIIYLWSIGIETIESCCGHNIVPGYIAVTDKYINKMIELGYIEMPNHNNCFFILNAY